LFLSRIEEEITTFRGGIKMKSKMYSKGDAVKAEVEKK